jgi:ABC-2 type transport system permease protein
MFPQIPQWLGYFFPTYYVIRPVVDISVNGAGFGDVWLYLLILIALLAVLVLVVNKVIRQLSTRALSLNG